MEIHFSGLFFSARLLPDGSLPSHSPFGNIRMLVPALALLDPARVNMYFCDFYCNYVTHYVTVVICEKHSEVCMRLQKSQISKYKYLLFVLKYF